MGDLASICCVGADCKNIVPGNVKFYPLARKSSKIVLVGWISQVSIILNLFLMQDSL